ncbi:MAG: cobH 1 [Firmicutes bacterium]|nr:cobH 1 [Bacillota bacterium]
MNYIMEPQAIETKSMEIIGAYLTGMNLNEQAVKVYSRIIHASGDPDYAKIISIHPDALAVGLQALKQGKPIYCDVEMVRTGINKRKLAEFGGEVHCLIADPSIAEQAKQAGITRSMAAMRTFADKLDGAAQQSPVPYITVHGNKGGSPIAAATINAMLYMLSNTR